MRTRPSFAMSLSPFLLAVILLGRSGSAAAQDPAQGQAAPPATPTPTEQSIQGSKVEAATAAAENAPADPDQGAVTQIGVQRLPGSAYPSPETRGIPYGSLSLTFHGLQWPYMPGPANGGSRFVIGLSGWGWIDTAYQKFAPWGDNPNIDQSRIKYWKQQARLLMRVTPTYSFDRDWFVQGQAEFVATEDQTIDRSQVGGADTDDLWLRIGQWNKWDFQVGRFEGWEVFHLGMGLDQNTFERIGAYGQGDKYNPEFYGVTDNQFRPSGAAGNFALHYYPFRFLRFEWLSTVGSIGQTPVYSARPVAILDLGWVKFKAATEYQKATAQQADDRTDKTSKGIGGAIQFIPSRHLEIGLNAAQGTIWSIASDGQFLTKGSLTRTSYGGFANISNGNLKHPLVFGVGSLFTRYVDQNDVHMNGTVDNYWQLQNFVAVQYVAFSQLYIKLVGGYARGHWINSEPAITYDDEMYSVRLRFSFYF